MASQGASHSHSMVLLSSISTLISQLVPSLGHPDADPRADRVLKLCLRIVGSRMAGGGGGGSASDSAVTEATRRKLVQAGRASDALKYSELLQQLLRPGHDDGLRRPAATLQLLQALVGSGAAPLGAAGASAALLASRPPPPPPTLSAGAVRAPEPQMAALASGR